MRATELRPGDEVTVSATATAALRSRGQAPAWCYGPRTGTVLSVREGHRGGLVRVYIAEPEHHRGVELLVGLHGIRVGSDGQTPEEASLEEAFARVVQATTVPDSV